MGGSVPKLSETDLSATSIGTTTPTTVLSTSWEEVSGVVVTPVDNR